MLGGTTNFELRSTECAFFGTCNTRLTKNIQNEKKRALQKFILLRFGRYFFNASQFLRGAMLHLHPKYARQLWRWLERRNARGTDKQRFGRHIQRHQQRKHCHYFGVQWR